MTFISKQGYFVSENGGRICDTAELDFSPVSFIGWKVGVRKGAPNLLLKALIVRRHREVEPMITSQCGVYTATNSMPNSNHNSATALDYNWLKHPFHAWGTWGPTAARSSTTSAAPSSSAATGPAPATRCPSSSTTERGTPGQRRSPTIYGTACGASSALAQRPPQESNCHRVRTTSTSEIPAMTSSPCSGA